MKNALILGSLDRGTILTSLQSGGYSKKLKILKSSVKNWQSICDILEQDKKNEILVLGKFTEYVLYLFCHPEYQEVAPRLLELIKNKNHAIFVYYENFVGNYSCTQKHSWLKEGIVNDEVFGYGTEFHSRLQGVSVLDGWIQKYLWRNEPEKYSEAHTVDSQSDSYISKIKGLLENIIQTDFNVIPYRKLVDIEIAGQNFIESIDQGLIFRVYVPNERLWAKELDKFVVLFRDYASTAVNSDVKVVQNRTGKGVTFSLYSNDGQIDKNNIGNLFEEFSSFLDLCSQDLNEASYVLGKSSIRKDRLAILLNRYAKEARRLMIDLKHDRENKVLSIKQRFESEIFDAEISAEVEQYIENSVPRAARPSGVLLGSQQKTELNASVVNITNNYIDKMEGIITNEIMGNINITTEDRQLRALIEDHVINAADRAELSSALDELKDQSISSNERTVSWQKLHGFLGKVADKVGDVGVHLLQKYLEQQLSL